MVAFGAGIVVGAAIWGGCRWGWGRNNVNININRHNEFNRKTNINAGRDRINAGGKGSTTGWKHDASHRKGVNYNNSKVAQQYGANKGSNRVTSNQARGHSKATASNRAGTGGQTRDRSAASSRPAPATANRSANNKSAARTPSATNRSLNNKSTSPGASTMNRSQGSSRSACSGSRSPSTDRRSSSRGAYSRGTPSYGGARGSASRGGGRRR